MGRGRGTVGRGRGKGKRKGEGKKNGERRRGRGNVKGKKKGRRGKGKGKGGRQERGHALSLPEAGRCESNLLLFLLPGRESGQEHGQTGGTQTKVGVVGLLH